jgi:hypothetical protein
MVCSIFALKEDMVLLVNLLIVDNFCFGFLFKGVITVNQGQSEVTP